MAADAPSDAGKAAAYWADLSVQQAKKSLRSSAITFWLIAVVVALLVIRLVLRLYT